jgi:periplasmic protein TonB
MTTTTKKRMLFGAFLSIATLIVLASCGNDTGSAKNETKSLTDSSVKTADNVDSAKIVAKKRKGKASVAVNIDNSLKIEKDKDGIYNKAEKMPEYPGGETALSKFVGDNINYPQNAIDDNTEGTVNVSFVIDENGKVVNPVATGKSAGRGLDEEAIRVVKTMPSWKPGTVKGKPVKTRLSLPVTFKLADA